MTEIVLKNHGCLDFKKYGAEFLIERVISHSGSSTYRIKCHDKYRNLKRGELDFIINILNIQCDNPVAVLNQETARSFLRSKDPKDK